MHNGDFSYGRRKSRLWREEDFAINSNIRKGCAMNKITVLLADDHSVVREGLQALLSAESDIRVVGHAETGVQAIELVESLRPDVVVMDIAMPQLNGVDATKHIRAASPATRVLILSAYSNPACIEQVFQLGAMGYLVKKTSVLVLAAAIREVFKGNRYTDPSITLPAVPKRAQAVSATARGDGRESALTSREIDVLKLTVKGLVNKQIAAELGISAKTSEKHRYSLMDKLGIHDTAGLTRYAIELGLVEPDGAG